jgi:hypothetical protein
MDVADWKFVMWQKALFSERAQRRARVRQALEYAGLRALC